MGNSSITQSSFHILLMPVFLISPVFFQPVQLYKNWRKLSSIERLTNFTYLFFLILSTSFFPWDWLVERDFTLAKLVQFPFRLFTPATILLFILVGFWLTKWEKKKNISRILNVAVLISFLEICLITSYYLMEHERRQIMLPPKSNTYVKADYETLR